VESISRTGTGAPLALESHRVQRADLVDSSTGRAVDEVLLVYMAKPRSFTREDVVEIQCHGNPVLVRRVIRMLTQAGARPAEPGEFTRRAFLNGRIGLVEAEAIDDLINAPTESSAELALGQLHGSLKARIVELRKRLIDLTALVEANLDFPEEDIDILTVSDLLHQVEDLSLRVEELASTHDRTRIVRGGIRTLIAGRPNAGKSSLLNLLLKSERAIVTATPGTTRDTIEEPLVLRGVLFSLIDSAGLRHTVEPVEAIGVRRTLDLMGQADLILYVLDSSVRPDEEELSLLSGADPKRFQLVLNKADLDPAVDPRIVESLAPLKPVRVCCVTGNGLEGLLDHLWQRANEELVPSSGDDVLVSERHRDLLRKAGRSLEDFATAVRQGTPVDVATLDLHEAKNSLGEIIGEIVTEDILDRIFERFCVGK